MSPPKSIAWEPLGPDYVQRYEETPQPPTEAEVALDLAARQELWRLGSLYFKLHEDQRRVYAQLDASKASRFVLEISRRWGKTWLLCCVAIEICLRKPHARVVYGAPTLKHLAEFVQPVIEAICQDAPANCCPVYNAARGHWEFPNGSHIHLFGADDRRKANRGRGPAADACIFDEAGFTPLLAYILSNIFRPQLLHTGGRTLLGSTPAEEPDHDFTRIAERAEVQGHYARRTIHDNPMLTPQQVSRFISEDAADEGMTVGQYMASDTFRREYLAERVVNKLLVVFPEWAIARDKLLVAVPRPEFFRAQTILDFGGNDPHAALFGYWHFALAKWIVEDELLLRDGENTAELATRIKEKEKVLWGVDKWAGTLRALKSPTQEILANLPDWITDAVYADAPEQPHSRWCDNDIQLARDLYQLHGIAFLPTAKDAKDRQVNCARVMIQSESVLVNPRCVDTDRHLRTTTWANAKRKEYKRRAGEHGDLGDCVVYGCRNLDKTNPYPAHWAGAPPEVRTEVVKKENDRARLNAALLGNTPLGRRLLASKR